MKILLQFFTMMLLSSIGSGAWSFFSTNPNSSPTPTPGPALSEKKALIEDEKNTIEIFKTNVDSVVNITSNLRINRGPFDLDGTEVPAGSGTGFVWDQQGHIITNFHVVANSKSLMVSFHKDQEKYPATIVGASPARDIAVLKMSKLPAKFTPVSVGQSSDLMVGQKSLAIGNPFGLDHTVTTGIISALDRQIPGYGGVTIYGMIQTDASINPGNSGGPLLDSSGKVIGMNTMIFSSSGSSAGVGFAVPIDVIKRVVPDLVAHGKEIRPGLGIRPLSDQQKQYLGIEKGVIVGGVIPQGPAQSAGLEGMAEDRFGRIYLGDIILSIDGKEVNSFDDIFHVLENYQVGSSVTVQFLRENKIKTAQLKLMQL